MGGSDYFRILVVSITFIKAYPYLIEWPIISLKGHGADADVEHMFDMGAETMNLPLEEKMKFEQGDSGMSFG